MWTTLVTEATLSFINCARFSFPSLGLPKLWTCTLIDGYFKLNYNPVIVDKAAPKECPVLMILLTEYFEINYEITLNNFF